MAVWIIAGTAAVAVVMGGVAAVLLWDAFRDKATPEELDRRYCFFADED